MKKVLKLLSLVLIGFIPFVLNAETEDKEWRWYTFIEKDVTYKKDVENNCEYFDKENYIDGDWVYSTVKPEEKANREIVETFIDIPVKREYINMIKIRKFETIEIIENLKLYELQFLDKNGQRIDYEIINHYIGPGEIESIKDNDISTFVELYFNSDMTIVFKNPINMKDVTIKVVYNNTFNFKGLNFETYITEELNTNMVSYYSTNNKVECTSEHCTMSIKYEDVYDKTIIIRTPAYKYRDKYFKCYKKEKLYIPGYFKNLGGFIKDELDYQVKEIAQTEPIEEIKTTIIKEKCDLPILNENPGMILNETINKSDDTQSNEKDIATNNIEDKIAFVAKPNEKKSEKIPFFVLPLILIFLLVLTVIVTKRVKKCRMK